MTKDEFTSRFRHQLLGLMGEAWAVRKETPTEFGRLMDLHMIRVKQLLGEMYDALRPPKQVDPERPTEVVDVSKLRAVAGNVGAKQNGRTA